MSEIPLSIIALGESYVRLWEQFSEFPTREEVSEHIRIFKPRSLANLDCKGHGPAGRLVFAGRRCRALSFRRMPESNPLIIEQY